MALETKRRSVNRYFVLAFAVLTNALANILIKAAMGGRQDISVLNTQSLLRGFLFNGTLWLGIVCFGLALMAYSYVLTTIPLSVAYPTMTSLGLVIVTLVAVLHFGETLNPIQIAGIFAIIAGVWMVAR